jgi:hypothetical protein
MRGGADDEGDPIADLLASIDATGRPALDWVVRWSEGGREPLAAAWEAANDPAALISLLARVRRQPESVALDAVFAVSRWRLGFVWDVNPADGRTRLNYAGASPRSACEAIRASFAPPRLADVLELDR